MSVTLRVLLVVVSVCTCAWVLHSIRRSQVKIEDSVFWFLFSALLVVMGIFPQIMTFGANLIGVIAPVNFVFLVIIFVLIAKLFRMNIRISQLNSKLQFLTERYALDHKRPDETEQNDE